MNLWGKNNYELDFTEKIIIREERGCVKHAEFRLIITKTKTITTHVYVGNLELKKQDRKLT